MFVAQKSDGGGMVASEREMEIEERERRDETNEEDGVRRLQG